MSRFLTQTQGLEITPLIYNYILKQTQETRVFGFQEKKENKPETTQDFKATTHDSTAQGLTSQETVQNYFC